MKDSQAVEKSTYANDLKATESNITRTEEALKIESPDSDRYSELESDLAAYNRVYERLQTDEGKYIVSPAEIVDYHSRLDDFYMTPPDVFSPGTENYTLVVDLEKRFSNGILSTDEFLREMDRLALMIQMEEID